MGAPPSPNLNDGTANGKSNLFARSEAVLAKKLPRVIGFLTGSTYSSTLLLVKRRSPVGQSNESQYGRFLSRPGVLMPNVTTHPTPQELSDFGLGKLPEEAAFAIIRHLDACADCRKAVANVPPGFLSREVADHRG